MERDCPGRRTTLSRVVDTPNTREGTWDFNVYSRYRVERGRLRLSSAGVIVSTTHIDAHLQAMSGHASSHQTKGVACAMQLKTGKAGFHDT